MEYQPTETIHVLEHLLETVEENLRELQTHPEIPGYLTAELTHIRSSAKLSLLNILEQRDPVAPKTLHFKTMEDVSEGIGADDCESLFNVHPLTQRSVHYEVCGPISTTLIEMRNGAVS